MKKNRAKSSSVFPSKPSNKRLWFILSLIALSSFGYFCYSSASTNDFTNWDDNGYVIDNDQVKSLSTDNLKTMFSTYVMGNYHPLAMLSLAIDFHFNKLDPQGYHRTSVRIHLINSLLVFFFIYLLAENLLAAFIAALLFAVHPMHVESVAWVSERKDILYVLFYLAACCSYLLFLKPNRKKIFYGLSIFFFACSLLSKGQAVTLPVVLFLIDLFKARKIDRKLIFEKIPFLLMSLTMGIVAVMAQHSSNAIHDIKDYALIDRLLFASYAFLLYVWKFFVPLDLSAFHPYPVKNGNFYPYLLYLAPLLAVAAIYFVLRFYKTQQKLVFGALFFMVNIFLLLQLLPVGNAVISERYTYLGYIGVYFMVATLVAPVLEQNKNRVLAAISLLGFVIFLAYQTRERVKIWNNSESLWLNVIGQYPEVPIAYNNLGSYYQKKNRIEEALLRFNKAIQLTPDYPEALINRSDIHRVQGNIDLAIADCDKAMQVNSEYQGAHMNRGIAYCIAGRLEEAMVDFNWVLARDPANVNAHCNRGNLFSMKGKLDSALYDYNMAIASNPEYTSAYTNRGKCYVDMKKYDEAIVDLTLVILQEPSNVEAYFLRNMAYQGKADYSKAYTDAYAAKQLGRKIEESYLNELKRRAGGE